nr:ATP-binding cassette domain-containing protein [Geodermatophilaceae bacterium]
ALRMLAGLDEVDEGSVFIGGRDVSRLPPKRRDIAMVFQSYALYPHKSVAENMGFALKLRGVPKAEVAQKVAEAAKLLDLSGLLDRRPKALSGGQRQRVAMGRAIVREPSVFLMDEPLSNLDAKLRVETRANIAALQQRLGTTTVYVTHDQVEAMTMGHRVAVLSQGVLQQCATPRGLYDRPANAFVAGFIGSPAMNLSIATLSAAGITLGQLALPLPRPMLDGPLVGLTEVQVGVRPESLELVSSARPGIELTVELVEELGADAYVYGTARLGAPTRFAVRVDGRNPPAVGKAVTIALRRLDEIHLFHPATGERIAS